MWLAVVFHEQVIAVAQQTKDMLVEFDPRPMYQAAVDALNKGDWLRASGLANRLLQQLPGHAGVQFVAGVAAMNLQQMPQAMQHLQQAVRLNPARADYAAQLAKLLSDGRMLREALTVADAAVNAGPTDAMTADTLGVVYTRGNEHTKAVAMFERAVALFPQQAAFRFNLATSLTFAGRLEDAEREYEACLSRQPHYWKAHLALAKLRKSGPDNNHLSRLQTLLASCPEADNDARMYLNLALSAELEDLRDDAAAFNHLVAGKQAGGVGRKGSRARDAALFAAVREAFPEPIADNAIGSDNAEPIFIVGMPRSGTTLMDRILSSHSQVHSAGELQNFGVVLKRASGSMTPELIDVDCIQRARHLPWQKVGDAYVASTRPGTASKPRFTDKLPHNFLYLGHIAQALPKARILCMRRNPMDTCLGNFRQLFAQSTPYYDYSFDLLDTGAYYLQFDALLRHWQQVMPGRILEVHYEDLVDAPEATMRMALAHCGLPWEDACLQFQDNTAPVATASAVQVREPLHRGAMQRWKRFEPQLQPLRELLEQGGIEI